LEVELNAEKVNSNNSSCNQARETIPTAIGYGFVFWVSGLNGDNSKSAPCQQKSAIEMCKYANSKKTRVILKKNNMFILFEMTCVRDASTTRSCYSFLLFNEATHVTRVKNAKCGTSLRRDMPCYKSPATAASITAQCYSSCHQMCVHIIGMYVCINYVCM